MAGFYVKCNTELKWVNSSGSFNLITVLLSEAGLKNPHLFGPLSWPERSYELGSHLLSFCNSGNIFEIYVLVFSETLYGVRGLYGDNHTTAGFFEKKYFAPKMGKMGQRWVFWVIWEIWPLIFPDCSLWWKFILFAIFLHKSYI